MDDLENIDDLDLPLNPTLSSLIELIGEPKSIIFAVKFAGKRVYIPLSVKPCKISRVIGLELLENIVNIYAGMIVEVPTSIGRKAAVARMLNNGTPVSDIVSALFCNRRYVYKVKKQLNEDGLKGLFDVPVNLDRDQLSLFDE